jgi:hypothetical protein
LGQPVRVGEVFAVLYPVPGVAYALLKRLARSGEPAAIEGCEFADVAISEHELAYAGVLAVNLLGGGP